MWRNNGNGTFSEVTDLMAFTGSEPSINAVGTDYNNDRAVDLVLPEGRRPQFLKTREKENS